MIGTLLPRTKRLPKLLSRPEWDVAHLVDRMFGHDEQWWPLSERFMPEVNVAEREGEFEVTVELPGLKVEEIEVEMHEGQLWISGEKMEEQEEKGKTFHRIERRHGEFRRMIALPGSVDEDKVEATFEDGVLKITVSKTEEAKPKHIKVKG